MSKNLDDLDLAFFAAVPGVLRPAFWEPFPSSKSPGDNQSITSSTTPCDGLSSTAFSSHGKREWFGKILVETVNHYRKMYREKNLKGQTSAPENQRECLGKILLDTAKHYRNMHREKNWKGEISAVVNDDITWNSFVEDKQQIAIKMKEREIRASIIDREILEKNKVKFKEFSDLMQIENPYHRRHVIVWRELKDEDVMTIESKLATDEMFQKRNSLSVAHTQLMLKKEIYNIIAVCDQNAHRAAAAIFLKENHF